MDRFLGPAPGERTLKSWLAVVLDNEANTMMDQEQPEKARPLLEGGRELFIKRSTVQHPPADQPRARGTKRSPLGPRPCPAPLKLPTEAIRVDAERIGMWRAAHRMN